MTELPPRPTRGLARVTFRANADTIRIELEQVWDCQGHLRAPSRQARHHELPPVPAPHPPGTRPRYRPKCHGAQPASPRSAAPSPPLCGGARIAFPAITRMFPCRTSPQRNLQSLTRTQSPSATTLRRSPIFFGAKPQVIDVLGLVAARACRLNELRRQVLVDKEARCRHAPCCGPALLDASPVRQAGLRGRPRRGCARA